MDFITDLPTTTGLFAGATNIWVIMDRLTKDGYFIPCYSMKAPHLARLFLQFVLQNHGLPESITSDRRPQFVSGFWRELCQQLGIQVKLSTAYHPETDGQTERTNQSIEQYLRAFVNHVQDDWGEWLPIAKFALSNQVN